MNFASLLRQIIMEQSRFEILRDALTKPTKSKEGKAQKPKMTATEFLDLVQGDPTTKMNNVDPETADSKELEKIKAGKYVNWLIKQYLTPSTERQPGEPGYENEVKNVKATFLEDLYKVTNDLQKFERFKNRLPQEQRDINSFTIKSLYDAVKDFSLEKTKASKEEKQAASTTYQHPGGEIIYRGNDWTVVKIEDKGALGKDAACFYGGYYLEPSKGETRWCTSSPGLDWFNRYIKDGPLYVVIPNNWSGKVGEKSGLPANRYQFHFPSNQFMDVNDHGVDLVQLLNGQMSELKHIFKPEFAKGLTVGGEKLHIDDLNRGNVGKFVSLYGLDELFDSLPATLKEIQIQNRGNNHINITIPTTIGRFKNLEGLNFDNCISEIPDEVCGLPKLTFLSIVNCPDLKSIPDCIANLPNLLFLNLKNSPNVKIPQSIKDTAIDYGGGLWDMKG